LTVDSAYPVQPSSPMRPTRMRPNSVRTHPSEGV
jgi:hypothetical protein